MRRVGVLATAVALLVPAAAAAATAQVRPGGTTVTLVTDDSFATSDVVMREFTKRTGIRVNVLPAGDAGTAFDEVVRTKNAPVGDVFYGLDNTLLSRALDEGIFSPYKSPELAKIPSELRLDPKHRVSPVDTRDVCINYDKKYFADKKIPMPMTLDDLTNPRYKGLLVVENPATSSQGLAFLLATVAQFGSKGWQNYWAKLRDNDVKVVDSWEQAYKTEFSGSSGRGAYPLVVSYALSPTTEVADSTHSQRQPPTGALLNTCFRQINFVGILTGTTHERAAKQLVDFMLSPTFQRDTPLQMHVLPARDGTKLPEVFVKYAKVSPTPFSLPPERIAANRDTWINQWTDAVLR